MWKTRASPMSALRRMAISALLAFCVLYLFYSIFVNTDTTPPTQPRHWLDEASAKYDEILALKASKKPSAPSGTSLSWLQKLKQQQHHLLDSSPSAAPSLSSIASSPAAYSGPSKVVVMGALSHEDTSWTKSLEPSGWQSVVYIVDAEDTSPHSSSLTSSKHLNQPSSQTLLRTATNKGREANAYLSYIIQHYDTLPEIIAFVHAHEAGFPRAWHVDNEDHSNVVSLSRLRTDPVLREGYVNLRCLHSPGCPAEIRLDRALDSIDHVMNRLNAPADEWTGGSDRTLHKKPGRKNTETGRPDTKAKGLDAVPKMKHPEAERPPAPPDLAHEFAMPDAMMALFNLSRTELPPALGVPCCSQFAVSRAQILQRPRAEYEWFYRWLMETPLLDDVSGRVLEYLWHVMFGREAVYCNDVLQCYCKTYGLWC